MTIQVIQIDPELKKLIPALSAEEFKQLEANLLRDGCRDPLSLWQTETGETVLIDGHNRYNICQRHNIPFTTASFTFASRIHVKVWIGEHQLGRRNVTDDQRAILANDVREFRSAIAIIEQRKNAGMARGVAEIQSQIANGSVKTSDPSTTDELRKRFPPPAHVDTRAAVAAEVGLSERKVRHAQEIKKDAPEVHDLVRSGAVTMVEGKKLASLPEPVREIALAALAKPDQDVRGAIREAKKTDYNATIAVVQPKRLEGTYRVLYADPPWKYVGLNQADEYGHAERHYDCLTDDQLCTYRPGDGSRIVRDMMDKDSVMFMWVTSPLLERCFPIIKAWGFQYKSSFIWDKIDHVMGHYNSVRHELLLICTRGSCKPDVPKLIDSVVSIKRTRHSEKPHEFYGIIDSLYDHGRKLELFCRKPQAGWDSDGNEASAPVVFPPPPFLPPPPALPPTL